MKYLILNATHCYLMKDRRFRGSPVFNTERAFAWEMSAAERDQQLADPTLPPSCSVEEVPDSPTP